MAQPPALPLAQMDSELDFRPVELIPLTQLRDGAEALLAMEVSDDLMPLGLQAGEKPAVPLGADDLVAYYEKQLAATQLVQHRLQQQFNQLAEEKVALETSLSVQTAALQQQLVLAREKADRALAQAEQAQQLVHDAHAAVGEIVGAVTQLAELLDVAGASNELSHSFEAVAHSTQRTFQAVAAAQEGTQVVLEFQLEARDACQVSPLLTAGSVGSQRDAEHRTSLEGEAARLRQELEEAKRRSNDLEAEMHAAQLLFTGLEAEVVSLQHDQAQAAAKLQVSQEELIAARDQLLAARQALTAAESPEANLLNQGLVKLDAHLSTIRSFIESLSMPQPASVVDASSGDTLQDVPSVILVDGATDAGIEKLKELVSGLQQQIKVKDGELRAARYASLVVRHRADARSGFGESPSRSAQPLGGSLEESPTMSPAEQLARGGDRSSRMPMPAFSYLLAARSQALQSPEAAIGGLSTVQVALIAAEREVLSLRSQLSHRQQHIKLLEQRLLEQSQDIAAMLNRGDALAASPFGSRKASFVERTFGVGTEVLMPQKAWDFDGLDMSDASGNLAEQMRPQEFSSGTGGDGGGPGRLVQTPLADRDDSSNSARPAEERRSSGLQGGVHAPQMVPLNALIDRDRTIQQLRAQIDEFRAVLAAAAGSGLEQEQTRSVSDGGQKVQQLAVGAYADKALDAEPLPTSLQPHPDLARALNVPDYNPRITLEDLPEGFTEGIRWADGSNGGYAGDAQAAGPSDAPRPFRLSSGGPLPFQLAGGADGVGVVMGGPVGSAATASATSACPTDGLKSPDSSRAIMDARQLSCSSSTQRFDDMKRQLDEATLKLEGTQAKLARTTSEVASLQNLLDALSKADPSELIPSGVLSPVAGGGSDDGQLPAARQISFEEVRAQLPAGSGLSYSTKQLSDLRAQLQEVMKAIQASQDHLSTMQAEAGAKEASIAHLTEQLEALRAVTAPPAVEGTGSLLLSKPTLARQPVPDQEQQGGRLERTASAATSPRSPSAGGGATSALPLPPHLTTPSQRPAINADAATYTPSLVMNPMFHRDVPGSGGDTTGSDARAALFSSSPAAVADGCPSPFRAHEQPDPSATTVHRNLLFDEDSMPVPKESQQWQDSQQWQYQHDPRFSSGTINDATEPEALLRAGQSARNAPADSTKLAAQLEELQAARMSLGHELSAVYETAAGSSCLPSVPRPSSQLGAPPASPSRLSTTAGAAAGVRLPADRSQSERWSFDGRADNPAALRSPYASSVVSDLESVLSQRVTDLEDEIMTERNSFADQLTLLKRAKRELEARIKELTAELRLKDEQVAQLQDKRGSRGRKPSESKVVELQQTVANLTAELAAKDATIRARQDLIDDMEQAQSIATRTISAEIANYRQQLADADSEVDSLRKQLAKAEDDLIVALQTAKLHAAALNQDEDRSPRAEPQDLAVLKGRIVALELELQVATQRLATSAGELDAMAVELQAGAQRLADAQAKASAAEADLAAERNTRRQLEGQVAEADSVIASLKAELAGQDARLAAANALKARVDALEAELQVSTERLGASTHELSVMALELEASAQRLTEARAAAAAVEADLEAERQACKHLEQQIADIQTPQQEPGGSPSVDAVEARDASAPCSQQPAEDQAQEPVHELAELQSQLLGAAAANAQLQASMYESAQSYLAERLEEGSRTEARLRGLLTDLTEARERVQALLEAAARTQAEMGAASACRDAALARVDELLAVNPQAQAADAERLPAVPEGAAVEATESGVLLAGASEHAQSKLQTAQADAERAQEQLHSQVLQAEERVRALQAEVETHASTLRAIGAARSDEQEHITSLQAALAAAQSLNDSLWSQLEAVAGAVGMDVSGARKASSSAEVVGPGGSHDAASDAADVRLPAGPTRGVASDSGRGSDSQLARANWASASLAGSDSFQRGQSAGWDNMFSVLAGAAAATTPQSRHQPEEQEASKPSTVWSGPLNFNQAFLSGAARSAAAALQSVGDVPVSPAGKSTTLISTSSSPASSSGTAPAASATDAESHGSGEVLSSTGSRRSLDSHGAGRRSQLAQLPASQPSEKQAPLQETASQVPIEQRGLQLLQPQDETITAAAADAAGRCRKGCADGKSGATTVPNVAAAVQACLDTLRADAASVREHLQSVQDQLASTQDQLAQLRGAHADLLEKPTEARAAAQDLQQRILELEVLLAENQAKLQTTITGHGSVQAALEEHSPISDWHQSMPSRSVPHAEVEEANRGGWITDVEPVRGAQQQQLEDAVASCDTAVGQLAEDRTVILDLQQRVQTAELAASAEKHRAEELDALLAKKQQKLQIVQTELEEASRAHSAAIVNLEAARAALQGQLAGAEAAHAAKEEQLAEARAMVQELQKQIEDLQPALTDKQAKLQAAEAAHSAVQAELAEACRAHSATLAVLEAAKASLQQQLADAEVSREAAEGKLSEAHAAIHDSQQRVKELEALLADQQKKLQATDADQGTVKAELEEASRAHSAAIADLEAAMVALQQQLADAQAARELNDGHLAEARAAVQQFQQEAKELEASLANKQQELQAAEADCRAVRAELEEVHRIHSAAVMNTEAAKAALLQQLADAEAGREAREEQLAEARATVHGSQQQVKMLEAALAEKKEKLQATEAELEEVIRANAAAVAHLEAASTAAEQSAAANQQRLSELNAALNEKQERLDAADGAHSALQAEMNEVSRGHTATVEDLETVKAQLQQLLSDAEASRGATDEQLKEARTAVQDLQQRLAAAEQSAAADQQRLSELESTLADKQETLDATEAGRSAVQAELEEASRAHTATVADLEAAKVELQQRLVDGEASRDAIEEQLKEARTAVQDLQQRLSELEAALADKQERLEATEAGRSAVQAELEEASRAHTATVADLEAAKVELQQRLVDGEASRDAIEEQLKEARTAVQDLQQRLAAAEQSAAADQQRLSELEAALADKQERLESVQAGCRAVQAELEEAKEHEAELRAVSERQLSDVQAQLTAKDQELGSLLSKIAALNAQLAAVGALIADHAPQIRPLPTTTVSRALPAEHAAPPLSEESLAASVAGMRASLTRRAEVAEQDAAALVARVAGLTESLDEARALVGRLEGLLAQSDVELRAAMERVQELEGLLREKEGILQEQQVDRQGIAQELAALQQRIVVLQEDVQGARDNANTVSAQLDEYRAISRQQCTEAELARDDAVMAAEAARDECESLRAGLMAAKTEAEEHRARLAAVEVELSKVEAQMDGLQRGVRSSEAQAEELRAELAAVQYDLILARDERDDAIRQLDAAALKHDEFQQQLGKLRQELECAGLEHKSAAQQLADAIAELSAARHEQKTVLEEAGSNLDAARQEVSELRAKLGATEGELLSTVKELADTRERLLAAIAERDAATANLAEDRAADQSKLLSAVKELADTRERLIAAIAERDVAAANLAEDRAADQSKLLNAVKELADTREQLLAAIAERDVAAANLAEDRAADQSRLLNAVKELADTRERLLAAVAERDAATAKLAAVQVELAAVTQLLASARDAADAKHAEHNATLELLETALADKNTACRDLAGVRSELSTAVDILAGAREQRDVAVQQLEEMRAEVSVLQNELNALAKQLLAKQLAGAEEERQSALDASNAAAARFAELQAQVSASGRLLTSTHEAMEAKCAEHEAAVQLLNLAHADKDALSTQLAGARAEVLAALGELSDARAQRDAAMQQLNAVRDVLAAIEDERSSSAAAAAVTAAVMREQQRTVEAQQRTLDASRASEAARVAEHLRALEHRADDLTRHAEDLQRRLNAAEAHLTSERAEAQVVRARLELQLASARAELEATAVERTTALQQQAAVRAELAEITSRCAALEDELSSAEQQAEAVRDQLDDLKQQLLDVESRAAVERLGAETARTKAEELQGKLRADLAATHAELVAVAAQRDALEAQLAVVLPTLSAAQAEQAAGVRQLSNLHSDQAVLESHLGPLEEHARLLERQAEDLRQQLALAEDRRMADQAETRSAVSRLEAQLDAARAELAAVAAARDASVQQLAQVRFENFEGASARTTLEVQARGLQHHADQLQQQVGSLQEQVTAVEARLQAERAELHSARAQTATVRAELAAVMAERDTAADQAAALRSELASTRSERAAAAQQLASTTQAKAELEDQVRSLEQRAVQLQSQLDAAARLREQQVADRETELADERARHSATEALLSTTKADLAAALSNNAGVQQQVSDVHEELAALRKELAVATKELASQQALTESRVAEMQAKLAQARTQASEAADHVQQLQSELADTRAALRTAEQQLLDRDVDAKGMVTGLEEALEATRAALEAERARGEQKAKELQDQLQAAIAAGASAREHMKQARDDLDAARAAQLAQQAAAEADIVSLKEQLFEAREALQDAQHAAREQEAELKANVQALKKAAASSQQRASFLDAQATAARTAEAEAQGALVEAQRALTEAMHNMGKQEAEAGSRIASLEAGLSAAKEEIARLESRQKQSENASRTAEDEIVAMGDKLREERERTSQLEPRIDSLAGEMSALQTELANARTALSRYEAYAYDAEAEIQELRNAAEASAEENNRLQQQLDQLVDQLRRQTQQLRAAEEDTAQLRQEVAAMNFSGTGTRRSGSTSRGRSAERRHGSAGRVAAAGTRPAGAPGSILDDSVNAQQLLILRKPQAAGGRQQPAFSSGSNSALSRSGDARAGQPPGRGRAGSAEPRQARGAEAPERFPVDAAGGHGAAPRSPPMSPSSALQKRLTDEATQLRWEVVADSSRVRELQEKRAGGAFLSRAEVSEMELLTARLGAHHARISAIMDTVKLARGQQQGGPEAAFSRTADAAPNGRELSDRAVGPNAATGKRHAYQQMSSPLPARDVAPSDLVFPDQPRQQPAFHPHPPAHPPLEQHAADGGLGAQAFGGAMRGSPAMTSPAPGGGKRMGSQGSGVKPEGPSRLRFFDLETRAEPAELPRGGAGAGADAVTDEFLLSVRTALGRRDDMRGQTGTPKYGRDIARRPGDITPNQDVDSVHGGLMDYSGGAYSGGQVHSGSDSVSPHALGHTYSACPSPTNRSVRSTQATINVSPWYPPGATPARGASPPGRPVSPANMTARRATGGRSAGVTPVRERGGLPDPHAAETDGAEGVASSMLSAVGGEAVGAGPGGGGGAGGAPRAATRYRTPYLRMLQDMVWAGQGGGRMPAAGASGTVRRGAAAADAAARPGHGAAVQAVATPQQVAATPPRPDAVERQHQASSNPGFDATGHWGSGGGAVDGSPRAPSQGGSAGGSRSHSPNRALYLPSGIGPGSPTPSCG